jgi:hypothetical protein
MPPIPPLRRAKPSVSTKLQAWSVVFRVVLDEMAHFDAVSVPAGRSLSESELRAAAAPELMGRRQTHIDTAATVAASLVAGADVDT